MIFQPGTYYVGDPGFVLPNDDLRTLFAQAMHGEIISGPREIVSSQRWEENKIISDLYWLAATPYKSGTIYDNNNKGWGIDWGCFGVVPWEWLSCPGCYDVNKVEFTEKFECLFTEKSITIGHLHFTYDPK